MCLSVCNSPGQLHMSRPEPYRQRGTQVEVDVGAEAVRAKLCSPVWGRGDQPCGGHGLQPSTVRGAWCVASGCHMGSGQGSGQGGTGNTHWLQHMNTGWDVPPHPLPMWHPVAVRHAPSGMPFPPAWGVPTGCRAWIGGGEGHHVQVCGLSFPHEKLTW